MIYNSVSIALLTFVLMVLLFSLIFFFTKEKKTKGFLLLGLEGYRAHFISQTLKYGAVLAFLLGNYFLFLALSRPVEKKLEPKTTENGIDILFVLDISQSMLIEDMKPLENRLASSKHHIEEFIKNRTSDRMGLIVFSGEAYTRVPLTFDHSLLIENLEDVEISDYIKQGTAIGVALAAGINRVKESESKTKIIVLLTDGENNTGVIDPLTALDLTVELGAKVYTIGVGRDGQSQLPIFSQDRFGRKVKSYRPFPTKINEELLTEIANKTGGQFYRASEESDMSRIFSSIDKLEKSKIKRPNTYKIIERFQEPLRLSMLFFLVVVCIEIYFWRGL